MSRSWIFFACLGIVALSLDAQAQRADRAQRLDRLDRAQDRIAARDRIIDRRATDRARERTVVDPQVRDVEPDPARAIDEIRETDQSDSSITETTEDTAIILDSFGDRIRRGEVLAVNPSAGAKAELARRELRPVRQRTLSDQAVLHLYRSHSAVNLTEALEELRQIDPSGIYALNHVFSPRGAPVEDRIVTEVSPAPSNAPCSVGLIDGPVDRLPTAHQAFIARSERFEIGPKSSSSHGAAVALRLLKSATRHQPRRQIGLCVADVFVLGAEDTITTEALTAAMSWQMSQNVSLINASLAGPHNDIVAWSVDRFIAAGGTLIAAVGNGGPLSRDIYPAAYDGVIGVTAVDADGEVYVFASQGPHVDISARGVSVDVSDIGVADPISGTSFAAPIVSGWLAARGDTFEQIKPVLIDRGEIGRDNEYGLGELRYAPEGMLTAAAFDQSSD